jgi:hypothetical protein
MSGFDLDAIKAKWLSLCGYCDAGMPTGCTCTGDDPRTTIAALVAEVERLKANQLPDGGEWRTEYGIAYSAVHSWCDPEDPDVQRRVWYGPAEPFPSESKSKPSDTPPESTTDQTTPNAP